MIRLIPTPLGNGRVIMPDALTKARIVRVKWERGRTGLFYATSPDLEDLLVTETTIYSIYKEIPRVIKDLYVACGMDVIVI